MLMRIVKTKLTNNLLLIVFSFYFLSLKFNDKRISKGDTL